MSKDREFVKRRKIEYKLLQMTTEDKIERKRGIGCNISWLDNI